MLELNRANVIVNETEAYILDSIETWVWSGFYTVADVQEMIVDILEDDADETMLRAAVQPEFEKKALAEVSWPETTDCDRLDRAFETLKQTGVIALHNAGYTMSDGLSDVGEHLATLERSEVRGYCFYHGQDLERALHGEGLMLAFGDLDMDPTAKTKVGEHIRTTLKDMGFEVAWNSDPEVRIHLPSIDWKRRSAI